MEDPKDILEKLSFSQLQALQLELSNGAEYLQHHVQKKLDDLQYRHTVCCATCLCDFDMTLHSPYTLVFGRDDFKKKASFCGLDCLQNFISQLSSVQKKRYNDDKGLN